MAILNRRHFLKQSGLVAGLAAGLSAWGSARADAAPSEGINVAIMGLRGRGRSLASLLAGQRAARVDALCGVDDSVPLVRNFLDCVKSRRRPDADIEAGHLSTTLCHVGNISHRLDRKLRWNGPAEQFIEDAEATRLLGREYRPPFLLPERV